MSAVVSPNSGPNVILLSGSGTLTVPIGAGGFIAWLLGAGGAGSVLAVQGGGGGGGGGAVGFSSSLLAGEGGTLFNYSAGNGNSSSNGMPTAMDGTANGAAFALSAGGGGKGGGGSGGAGGTASGGLTNYPGQNGADNNGAGGSGLGGMNGKDFNSDSTAPPTIANQGSGGNGALTGSSIAGRNGELVLQWT